MIFLLSTTLSSVSDHVFFCIISVPYFICTFVLSLLQPPDAFETPFDMKNYPQIFSQEFVEYFFAVEEALANGTEPPPRPKAFFVPEVKASTSTTSSGIEEKALSDLDALRKNTKKTSSGKSFGNKK